MTKLHADVSLEPGYFERMYARNPDPWKFATSQYEREKYRATVEALSGQRFRRGLEIGCSIGILSKLLAPHFDALVSVDVSERALEQARRRCKDLHSVSFLQMAVPRDFPAGHFDFVLLSEVGYYWSQDDLLLAIDRIASSAKGGTVELVHYLPKVEDYPRSGDEVHEAFLADPRYRRRAAERTEHYRIDLLTVSA